MARAILKRLLIAVGVVWLVATIVFLATQALPGDAASAILGKQATPERLAALQEELGTNVPISQQYTNWLGGLLRGDFGNSLANGIPVPEFLGPLLLNTLVLMALAATISTALGLLIGAWAAMRRDGIVDHVSTVVTLIVAALPEFVIGVLLILLFSTRVFHWFPATYGGRAGEPAWTNPDQLVLPVLTLVLAVAPYLSRMMRGTTLEVLEAPYVQQAMLKGLPERVVMLRHVVPNALGPVIQVTALQFAWLAGGVVIVEYLFRFPGIGTAVVDAVNGRDLPVAQALALFFAVFYVLVNLAADLVTGMVTPQARLGRQ